MKMLIAMLVAATTGFFVTMHVLPKKAEPLTDVETCGSLYCNVG